MSVPSSRRGLLYNGGYLIWFYLSLPGQVKGFFHSARPPLVPSLRTEVQRVALSAAFSTSAPAFFASVLRSLLSIRVQKTMPRQLPPCRAPAGIQMGTHAALLPAFRASDPFLLASVLASPAMFLALSMIWAETSLAFSVTVSPVSIPFSAMSPAARLSCEGGSRVVSSRFPFL